MLAEWIDWLQVTADRRGEKYTQIELADKSGLQQSYISKILHGKRGLGDKVLTKLCSAMEITKAEFYAGPPPERAKPKVEREFTMPHDVREDDLIRVRLMKIICELSDSELERIAAYAEGIYSSHESKKNIGNAS